MSRLDAISRRKSIRQYAPNALPASQLHQVREVLRNAPALYPGHDLRAVVLEDGDAVREVMPGLVGSYGKPSSPHFVLVTSAERPGWLENAGYAMEHAVLDLTMLGLATCWIGGQATRETFVPVDPDIPVDHRPVVLIAFGHAAEGGLLNRIKTKRKEMAEIAPEGVGANAELLEAARLSPSAANTQPWRFFIADDRIDVYASFRAPLLYRSRADHLQLMNQIDVGIALCHIAVAADAAGKKVRIAPESSPERDGLHYMTTVWLTGHPVR
ncbi:MAG TPA: nitroreductase family protein [Coriobacteriia bacterium]|nr:nitroreductase family protein [Coriobacteriia bacterium]